VLTFKNYKKLTNYSRPFFLKVITSTPPVKTLSDKADDDLKSKMEKIDLLEAAYFEQIRNNEKIRDEKENHFFAKAGLLYQTMSVLSAFSGLNANYQLHDNTHIFITGGGGYSKVLSPSFKFSTSATFNLPPYAYLQAKY